MAVAFGWAACRSGSDLRSADATSSVASGYPIVLRLSRIFDGSRHGATGSPTGKAGRARWAGRRPIVRGVAMNPVDHPMGGGEGRSSGGRHPCTPWGKPTKGHKTRKKGRSDKYIVKRRVVKRRGKK